MAFSAKFGIAESAKITSPLVAHGVPSSEGRHSRPRVATQILRRRPSPKPPCPSTRGSGTGQIEPPKNARRPCRISQIFAEFCRFLPFFVFLGRKQHAPIVADRRFLPGLPEEALFERFPGFRCQKKNLREKSSTAVWLIIRNMLFQVVL